MRCLGGKGFSQTYLNIKKRLLLAISIPTFTGIHVAATTESVFTSSLAASFVDTHCQQWENCLLHVKLHERGSPNAEVC